jgi:hypothetical protein
MPAWIDSQFPTGESRRQRIGPSGPVKSMPIDSCSYSVSRYRVPLSILLNIEQLQPIRLFISCKGFYNQSNAAIFDPAWP